MGFLLRNRYFKEGKNGITWDSRNSFGMLIFYFEVQQPMLVESLIIALCLEYRCCLLAIRY
jgi:hypothetical protein